MRELVKQILKKLGIAITQNQRYDSQTQRIIREVVHENSICVDVGCHKGEILDLILAQAPLQQHYAFEPIPSLYEELKLNYQQKCRVYNIALSKEVGRTTFHHVVSNPAFSGIRKREYQKEEEIEEITVETNMLDNIILANEKIDLIKIDVEGAEQWVLEGAIKTLERCKPVVIFEHGLGASEHYNSNPEEVFDLLFASGLQLRTMYNWLKKKPALTKMDFVHQYEQKLNYYFIASKQ